ncbi:helix-turn-helix domain-containing protein [Leucobacter denitrificans]|uniref:Helix-turn-helix transcriptional regulator n=1 Tax=Leucobacter denitrificans TaxID=683042 RepID=A0A7G9S785_9MICO|nr:helix-turn-helix transcriptional regulator [Leucobacter denitrificans]QNN63710.1 helix-turn-helix transcriptional regulator [Leucobacter denitrificans]
MNQSPQIQTAADFGYQLREEREKRGITQAELAARADVSTRWLSNFERGKSPRAELIKVLHVAKSLGLTFELAEVRQKELPPQQQALMDAFMSGPYAPKPNAGYPTATHQQSNAKKHTAEALEHDGEA